MNFAGLFDSTVCVYVTLTLVNFLWQGVVIAAAAVGLIGLMPRVSARTRYLIHLAALLLMASCLPVTYAVVYANGEQGKVVATSATEFTPSVSMSARGHHQATTHTPSAIPDAGPSEPTSEHQPQTSQAFNWQRLSPYTTSAYLMGVVAMLVRLLLALRGGQRLRRDSVPLDDASLVALFKQQAELLGVRIRPILVQCHRVAAPVVIGVVKPMILLPMSVATMGLTPDQLKAILTHELAHIRRYDHLVILIQRLIEAVLFFHPAVWYITKGLSLERESCCDEMVVKAGSKPFEYAELLVRVAALSRGSQGIGPSAAAAALASVGKLPQLRQRILRILGRQQKQQIRLTRSGTLMLGILLFTTLVLPLAALRTTAQSIDTGDQKSPSRMAPSQERWEVMNELPELQFITTWHRPPKDPTQPLKGQYWRPNGEIVSDQNKLARLRRIRGWGGESYGKDRKVLSLFISHPQFVRAPMGSVRFLDVKGAEIPSLQEVSHRGTQNLRAGGDPGWMFFQADMEPDAKVPPSATIRLRYTAGPWRHAGNIPVDARLGDTIAGVELPALGERPDGTAIVSIYVPKSVVTKRQYRVFARHKSDNDISPSGTLSFAPPNSPHTLTFEFDAQLSDISMFELRTRDIQVAEYHNVSLRAGHRTAVQTMRPTSDIYAEQGNSGSGEVGAILKELQKIKARLEKLESRKANHRPKPDSTRGPDIVALGKITFPENPTREAIKKYIQEILDVTRGQNTFSSDDPQIRLLAKVGEQNIDLLVDASVGPSMARFYLINAVVRLATERSKDLIITALPAYHDLIEAVVRNGWENDVKDILVEVMGRTGPSPGNSYLPSQWVRALAGFRDPATYDALIRNFVNGWNRYGTYKMIKDLPGIELGEHVAEAWAKVKQEPDNDWERLGMAIVAVEYGEKDALETLVANINSNLFDFFDYGRIRNAIMKHTQATGSNAEIIEWFEANKDNLRFDEDSKTFQVKR